MEAFSLGVKRVHAPGGCPEFARGCWRGERSLGFSALTQDGPGEQSALEASGVFPLFFSESIVLHGNRYWVSS